MTLKQIEVARKIYPSLSESNPQRPFIPNLRALWKTFCIGPRQHRSSDEPLLVYTSAAPDEITLESEETRCRTSGLPLRVVSRGGRCKIRR